MAWSQQIIGMLIGGMVVALLIVIAIILFVLWSKRKRYRNRKYQDKLHTGDASQVIQVTRIISTNQMFLYYSIGQLEINLIVTFNPKITIS